MNFEICRKSVETFRIERWAEFHLEVTYRLVADHYALAAAVQVIVTGLELFVDGTPALQSQYAKVRSILNTKIFDLYSELPSDTIEPIFEKVLRGRK